MKDIQRLVLPYLQNFWHQIRVSLFKSRYGAVTQSPHHRHQSVEVLQLQEFLMRESDKSDRREFSLILLYC